MTEKEVAPYQNNTIDIMSVDNLPNELPRDAAEMFGSVLSEHIIPALLQAEDSEIITNASITLKGNLNTPYLYLSDYAKGIV
jgi:saccharopine dehydrogenase (NAD+, L-lysine-forming)